MGGNIYGNLPDPATIPAYRGGISALPQEGGAKVGAAPRPVRLLAPRDVVYRRRLGPVSTRARRTAGLFKTVNSTSFFAPADRQAAADGAAQASG